MIRTEITTQVNRPIGEVFAYVADFTNLPAYDRWVESVEQTSEGPVAEGTTWTHRRVQGRRRFDAPIRMVEFTPGESLVMASGANGFEVRSTMSFKPSGTGATVLTEILEMRLSGLVRLFEPFIRRQVPGQAEEVHLKLKTVLEGQRRVEP